MKDGKGGKPRAAKGGGAVGHLQQLSESVDPNVPASLIMPGVRHLRSPCAKHEL